MSKDSFQVVPDRYRCLLQHKGSGRRLLSWQPAHLWDVCASTDGVPKSWASESWTPVSDSAFSAPISPRWREKMFALRASPFPPDPTARLLSNPRNISLSYPVICSICLPPILPLRLSALHHPSLFTASITPPLYFSIRSLSPFSFPLCALDRLALIKLIATVVHLNGSLSHQRLSSAAAAAALQNTRLQHGGTSSKSPTSVQTE